MKTTDKWERLHKDMYEATERMNSYRYITQQGRRRLKKLDNVISWLIIVACLLPFTLLVVALIIKFL